MPTPNLRARDLALDVISAVSDALDGDAAADREHTLEILQPRIKSFIEGVVSDLSEEYKSQQ